MSRGFLRGFAGLATHPTSATPTTQHSTGATGIFSSGETQTIGT